MPRVCGYRLSVCLSGILYCEGFLYCTDGDSDKENIDPN